MVEGGVVEGGGGGGGRGCNVDAQTETSNTLEGTLHIFWK